MICPICKSRHMGTVQIRRPWTHMVVAHGWREPKGQPRLKRRIVGRTLAEVDAERLDRTDTEGVA